MSAKRMSIYKASNPDPKINTVLHAVFSRTEITSFLSLDAYMRFERDITVGFLTKAFLSGYHIFLFFPESVTFAFGLEFLFPIIYFVTNSGCSTGTIFTPLFFFFVCFITHFLFARIL